MAKTVTNLKTPVSLRLPADITTTIDLYASEHGLTKTDAYEYFLRLAISASSAQSSSMELAELNKKMDSILGLLSQGGAQNNAAQQAREKDRVTQAIANVSKQFPAIKQAVLFGSFARGTFTDESDVDIRLKLDRDMRFNLRDLALFSKLIQGQINREVDVITVNSIKNKQLVQAIENEGELVYER